MKTAGPDRQFQNFSFQLSEFQLLLSVPPTAGAGGNSFARGSGRRWRSRMRVVREKQLATDKRGFHHFNF
jgi:hypothetical protein